MKKKILVGLVLIAAVVGLAFAAGRSITRYSKCGHEYCDGKKVNSSKKGDKIESIIDDNCPECKKAFCNILEQQANSGSDSAKSLWYDNCKE